MNRHTIGCSPATPAFNTSQPTAPLWYSGGGAEPYSLHEDAHLLRYLLERLGHKMFVQRRDLWQVRPSINQTPNILA